MGDAEEVLDRQPYVLIYSRRKLSNSKREESIKKLQEELSSVFTNCQKGNGDDATKGGTSATNLALKNYPQISKYWLKKLLTSFYPGPLNNFRYLCKHGHCYKQHVDNMIPINNEVHAKIVALFGEFGPSKFFQASIVNECKQCVHEKQVWNGKRELDAQFVEKSLDQSHLGESLVALDKKWYIIDAAW